MNVIHLSPGAYAKGKGLNHRYYTVLGSCISVVLWHQQSRFFAICHYVNAHNIRGLTFSADMQGYYGELILPFFLRELAMQGLQPKEVNTSLVGGASSLGSQNLHKHYQVGRVNMEFAEQFLHQHGFRVGLKDVGGVRGRRLEFDTTNGNCKVSSLSGMLSDENAS